MSFVSWINRISEYGVNDSIKSSLQRKIRLTNRIIMSCIVIVFITVAAWAIMGEPVIGSLLLLFNVFAVGALLLNKRGHHLFVRGSIVMLGLIIIFLFADAAGKEAGIQMFYFTILVAAYALFDYKELMVRMVIVFSVFICFVINEVFDYNMIPPVDINPKAITVLYYFHMWFAIGMIIALLSINLKFVYQDEEKLLHQNKELTMTSEALRLAQKTLSDNQMVMKKAKEQAEQALEIKSRFLSNMSHEIRTPMNSVLGFTDLMLEKGDITGVSLEYLHSIKKSTNHLLVIVNDILDFSKLESGKMKLENSNFILKEELESTLTPLSLKAGKKELEFKFEYDERIHDAIIADPVRIKQIIVNLTDNAIKFTDVGSILIRVDLINDEFLFQDIRIRVKDTGMGIPADQQASIFDSFSQAGVDGSKAYGGTGLGLAIVKELVALYHGKISVASEPGKGAQFDVELRIEKGNIQATVEKPSNQRIDFKDIKLDVLTVEDNEMNRLLLDQFFKNWNVNNVFAENGKEALDICKDRKFDLILMDLQMPVMSGFEAAKKIREEFEGLNKNTPIVAVTADAFPETKLKAQNAGLNAFLTKPIQKKSLINLIKELTIT